LGSPNSSSGGGGGGMSGSTSPTGITTTSPGTSCCEGGRPLVTDPVTGQSVCSCQYDPSRLTLSSYPRLSAYGPSPYAPASDQNPYPSLETSAFYSPLVSLQDAMHSVVLLLSSREKVEPNAEYSTANPFMS
jgi:hypothetical protein